MIGLPKLWGGGTIPITDANQECTDAMKRYYDMVAQNQSGLANTYRSMQTNTVTSPLAGQLSIRTDPQRRLLDMIGMRLRLEDGERLPFDFISAYEDGATVYVFTVTNNKPAIFEDDGSMFPSDTLITQLRLISK